MIYVVKIDGVKNEDGSLSEFEFDFYKHSDESLELKGFSHNKFTLKPSGEEFMVSSEGQIKTELEKQMYRTAHDLVLERGCSFFNNIIYKDFGGSL